MSLPDPTVLALNFGSASVKAATFAVRMGHASQGHAPELLERVSVESASDRFQARDDDAARLLEGVIDKFKRMEAAPIVIAHRIVHGADRPGPESLTPATLLQLHDLSTLAPLHQPLALSLVRAAMQRWPSARQIGVFDTSWHQTMVQSRRMLPIPGPLYARGVKRYGFHGLAFQSAMREIAEVAPEIARGRLVLAHLGGGSSLCAVLAGRCVSTTMGMTPLDGLPMSSRPGSLDPGVLLYLQRDLAMSPAEIDQLLWHESGLKGMSGESGDMRELLASGSDGARRAIDVYVHSVAQGVASMAACIGGIDGLAFSGGIGANAAEIRSRVASELEWMGIAIAPALNETNARDISHVLASVKTLVVQVDEEAELARSALG